MLARAATLGIIMEPGRNNFGLLRLAAAGSVVVSHAFYVATGDGSAQPLTGLTRYNLGQHAVHVFFVLSGLLVAGSLDRAPSLTAFVLARATRIIPGLAVCVLVTAFFLGPLVSTLPLMDYFNSAQVSAGALAAASLLMAVALGWISWTYVEQPCLRARGRLTQWIDRRTTKGRTEAGREPVAS